MLPLCFAAQDPKDLKLNKEMKRKNNYPNRMQLAEMLAVDACANVCVCVGGVIYTINIPSDKHSDSRAVGAIP